MSKKGKSAGGEQKENVFYSLIFRSFWTCTRLYRHGETFCSFVSHVVVRLLNTGQCVCVYVCVCVCVVFVVVVFHLVSRVLCFCFLSFRYNSLFSVTVWVVRYRLATNTGTVLFLSLVSLRPTNKKSSQSSHSSLPSASLSWYRPQETSMMSA